MTLAPVQRTELQTAKRSANTEEVAPGMANFLSGTKCWWKVWFGVRGSLQHVVQISATSRDAKVLHVWTPLALSLGLV